MKLPDFNSLLIEMVKYEKRLEKIDRIDISKTLKNIKGVYVFSENNKAVYVGKTDNLGRRLRQHTDSVSKNNQATFAFNIARLEWRENNKVQEKITRKILEETRSFKPHFEKAKKAVSNMRISFVEIDNPYHQYLFEFWLALKLKSKFNQFENH